MGKVINMRTATVFFMAANLWLIAFKDVVPGHIAPYLQAGAAAAAGMSALLHQFTSDIDK